MKVFDDLEREQADMYRWIRRNMTMEFFNHLTGTAGPVASELDIDRHLREAHHRDRAATFAKLNVESSKIKMGVLPPSHGRALLEYSQAVAVSSVFQEGLGGETQGDMNRAVTEKFLALCEEMAKLRSNL